MNKLEMESNSFSSIHDDFSSQNDTQTTMKYYLCLYQLKQKLRTVDKIKNFNEILYQ